MATTQAYVNALNAAYLLSLQEQEMLIKQIQEDIYQKTKQSMEDDDVSPYTWKEARERLAIAREQFRNGQYKTHAQVMEPRKGVTV